MRVKVNKMKYQDRIEEVKKNFDDRLLRRIEVEAMTGLSTSTLYSYIRRGAFPKPVRIGPKTVRWHYSVVKGWIASQGVQAA